MINLPGDYFNYTVVLVIFSLFQGSLILVLIYLFFEKVMVAKRKDFDGELEKQKAYEKALSILEQAKQESIKIMTDSHEKAKKILDSAHTISDKSKTLLDDQIQKLSDIQVMNMSKASIDLIESYKTILDTEKNKGIEEISAVSGLVKSQITEQLKDVKSLLEKETIETEKTAKVKIDQEFKQVQAEIEAYKTQKLKEFDKSLSDMLPKLAKEVLGVSLSVADHEKAVFTILENAKKAGKFKID